MELTQRGTPVPGCGRRTDVAARPQLHHVARQVLAAGRTAGLTGRTGRAVGAGGVAGAARALHRRGGARPGRVAHRRQRQHAARARLAGAAQRARALVGRLHADHRAGRARRSRRSCTGWSADTPGPRCTTRSCPRWHTRFVPQAVPSGWFEPLSVQIGAPVVQVSVPVWHGIRRRRAGAARACRSRSCRRCTPCWCRSGVPLARFPDSDADRRAGRARRRAGLAGVGRLAARARRAASRTCRRCRPGRCRSSAPFASDVAGVRAADRRRADDDAGVTRVRGHAGRPRRAGRAGAALADHVGAADGAVGRVAGLDADRRAGVAGDGAAAARLARRRCRSCRRRTPRRCRSALHTMSVPQDVPGGDVGAAVGARRRGARADQRPVVAPVRSACRRRRPGRSRRSPPGRPSRCRSRCRSACCPSPCRPARPSCRRCCRHDTACR